MYRSRRAVGHRAMIYFQVICVSALLLTSFQNCGSGSAFQVERFASLDDDFDSGDTDDTSTPGNSNQPMVPGLPPGQYAPPNKFAPTIQGDFSARSVRSGMGNLSGDTQVQINLQLSPGEGEETYQGLSFSTCESSSNILGVTCDAATGRIVIGPDRDRKCRSGQVNIKLQLRDVLDPSHYRPSDTPVSMMSPEVVIPVNVQNVCLNEGHLIASDGANQDQLGGQVSISGDTAVAISAFHDGAANNAGAAYIYQLQGNSWVQHQKITLPSAQADENLSSVDIKGDLIALGSPYATNFDGRVFIYERDGSTWSQSREFQAPNAGSTQQFGFSVSLSPDGQWLAVGAPGDTLNTGAVFIYQLSSASNSPVATLKPNGGVNFDEFGTEVSMSNNRVVVGAPVGLLFSDSRTGSAYVFEHTGGTNWVEQKLPLKDVPNGSRFGASVSISGDRVVIGAPFQNRGNRAQAGYVHIYERGATGWEHKTGISHQDVGANNEFGISVALEGSQLVVGAHRNTVGDNSRQGAAYYFTRGSNGSWNLAWKLMARQGAARDFFGGSVRISEDRVMVGARNSSPKGDNSGSAYVIDLP